jgi:hypothetical protein
MIEPRGVERLPPEQVLNVRVGGRVGTLEPLVHQYVNLRGDVRGVDASPERGSPREEGIPDSELRDALG